MSPMSAYEKQSNNRKISEKVMIIPRTPFETVRAQTELFASQCGQ